MQESQKPRKDTHKGKYLQTKPSVLETLPILSCWQTSVQQQWRPDTLVQYSQRAQGEPVHQGYSCKLSSAKERHLNKNSMLAASSITRSSQGRKETLDGRMYF